MSFDDRATHGEPDSHAVSLRRVESVEELIDTFRFKPDAAVLHTQDHAAGSVLPPLRGARDGVSMLEFEDNVTDISPAVEALGVKPIGLDEMLRRATARG